MLCMACPAYADPVTAGDHNCVESVLGSYTGPVDLEAHWSANSYTITYAPGAHGTCAGEGCGVFADDAEYDSSYTLRGLGTEEGKSGVTTNTGYHFTGWLGSSTATGYTPATYTETQTINPFQVAGPLTLTAQWTHNVSGAITLNSNVYPDNNTSSEVKYTTSTTEAVTGASPTPLYNAYNIGLFDSSTDAANAVAGTTTPLASITKPVKAGYTFTGFYDGNTQWIDGDGVIQTADIKTLIATENTGQTKTLYAHWTPVTYNVTYAAGTAANSSNPTVTHTPTGSTTATTVTYDAALTPAANGFTEPTGYDFDKWTGVSINSENGATAGAGAVDYNAGTSYSPYKLTTGIELTALWKPEEYTISYAKGTAGSRSADYVTGTAMAGTPVKYDDPSVTLSQIGYAAQGYHFVGWKSDYKFEDNSQPSGGFIYGTAGTGNTDWTVPVAGTYVHPGNLTLTAQWAANKYEIRYDCGTIPSGSTTSEFKTNSPRSAVEVTFDAAYSAMSNAPKSECDLEGYHFNGWNCEHGITSEGGTYTEVGNTTCYATWEKNTVRLTWYDDTADNNGNTITPTNDAANSCTYEGALVLPENTIEKTGYTFSGWHVRSTTSNP